MAKQILTKILDDLDGSEASETVTFALDGIGYEIDLNGKNALELREAMEKYINAGTRLGRVETRNAQVSRYGGSPVRVPQPQSTVNRDFNQQVRRWAAQNGWELAERGRIPQYIVEAFETRTPNPDFVAAQQAAKNVEQEVTATPPKRSRGRSVTTPAFAG